MKTAAAIIEKPDPAGSVGAGSQTLMRGLDLIEAVSHEVLSLSELAAKLDLTKSTTHRLLSALVDRGYLAFTPRSGYRLGPKLLLLGTLAQAQADLVQVARPYLEELAASSEDTVHLGVFDGDFALYLDKVPGRRRITISSRVGDRQPLSSTGLGKALMIDSPPAYWQERFDADQAAGAMKADGKVWMTRMAGYAEAGRAFDLEENEDQIRCVAAPIRDAAGKIVGAISVSTAAQYMSDERMTALSDEVRGTANAISHELGFEPTTPA
ncbi:IclR family transcriptional regulator [Sphingomonas sp. RP10(2022)]|uniref:IclR family transcriptional regulator n=1 Tax=Sphingomonas liriopis TaxID=2949094 RepID=A0A9X2HPD3_9SPHN|nr:IclR family transcriptional regulator [Sphingomonas liriopis]MCP3734708.1 IclR family transcriptional regulator [Sphingomonas liriopis]